jgi:predicted ATP-binding protein involved in virulence
LILFDEPENHLHPDIFSLFLNAMTLLVEKFKSYAVYSTHAPLVLQQTLARQVRVFRRIGNVPSITPLKMESFGANLTSITQEVFESASAGENFTPMLKKLLVEEPEGAISDRLFKLPLPLQTATQVRLIQEGSV